MAFRKMYGNISIMLHILFNQNPGKNKLNFINRFEGKNVLYIFHWIGPCADSVYKLQCPCQVYCTISCNLVWSFFLFGQSPWDWRPSSLIYISFFHWKSLMENISLLFLFCFVILSCPGRFLESCFHHLRH